MAKARRKSEWLIYNSDMDFDDVKEYMMENPDIYEEPTDEDVWATMSDLQEWNYEDTKDNLNQRLEGNIIVLADLGLWNGRRSAYKVIGDNLNEILDSQVRGMTDMKVWADRWNIKAEEHHHDGTNYYEFRLVTGNTASLKNKLYYGQKVTRADINRCTKSLRPYVAEIFGWER